MQIHPCVFDHYGTDVIPRALIERSLDQSVGRRRDWASGQYVGHLGVAEGAAEPVRTKQQNVAWLEPVAPFFEHQLVKGPDQICHDVCHRMGCRRFRQNLAAVDQILDMALVAAQLAQLAGAHPIQSAVPGPQAAALLIPDQQHRHRAADQRIRTNRCSLRPHLAVDFREAPLHLLHQRGTGQPRIQVAQCHDDAAARVVAALVSSRAIGNRPQADLGPLEHSVLISPAHRPHMGACSGTTRHLLQAFISGISCSIFSRQVK